MISNIQLLRVLSVIIVIAYHASGIILSDGFQDAWFLGVGHWGAFGVDVFFVISGFVIAMNHDMKNNSAGVFLKGRVKKIIPLYWLLTLACLIFHSVFSGDFGIDEFFKVISSMLFISGAFGFSSPTMYVGWSLESEIAFYIIFSLCLLIKSEYFRYISLFALVVLSILTGLARAVSLEFMYGVLIYIVYKKITIRYKLSSINFLVFSLLVIAASSLYKGSVDPSYSLRPFIYGVLSFVIVLCAVFSKDINSAIVNYIGRCTYSIYLVQVFTIPAITKFIYFINPLVNSYFVLFATVIVTLISGILTYELIEKRLSVSWFKKTLILNLAKSK